MKVLQKILDDQSQIGRFLILKFAFFISLLKYNFTKRTRTKKNNHRFYRKELLRNSLKRAQFVRKIG